MLNELKEILKNSLPKMLENVDIWDSLIINRRKPHTYRVFTQIDDVYRICLHKFNECDAHEAFLHPHPWPGAFVVLDGCYHMVIGRSDDRLSNPHPVAEFELSKFSGYEITETMTWHSVIPLKETYTIMLNGQPFTEPHTEVRTTKGKDLDKMPRDELVAHLEKFKNFVESYNSR